MKFPEDKIKIRQVIWEQDFSEFVAELYGRPYRLQQNDGGDYLGQNSYFAITIPDPNALEEFDPEDYDGPTFEEWRDAELKIRDHRYPINKGIADAHPSLGVYVGKEFLTPEDDWQFVLEWEREFAPPLPALLNDLSVRGAMDPGEYVLHVWW